MIAISTALVAWIAWVGKALGIKLGLLAVAITTVTAVILATKLAMVALLSTIPFIPIPGNIAAMIGWMLPSNTVPAIEIIINARLLIMLFETQWIYIKLYISAASWKIV